VPLEDIRSYMDTPDKSNVLPRKSLGSTCLQSKRKRNRNVPPDIQKRGVFTTPSAQQYGDPELCELLVTLVQEKVSVLIYRVAPKLQSCSLERNSKAFGKL
jgi:hypothetical protein